MTKIIDKYFITLPKISILVFCLLVLASLDNLLVMILVNIERNETPYFEK